MIHVQTLMRLVCVSGAATLLPHMLLVKGLGFSPKTLNPKGQGTGQGD